MKNNTSNNHGFMINIHAVDANPVSENNQGSATDTSIDIYELCFSSKKINGTSKNHWSMDTTQAVNANPESGINQGSVSHTYIDPDEVFSPSEKRVTMTNGQQDEYYSRDAFEINYNVDESTINRVWLCCRKNGKENDTKRESTGDQWWIRYLGMEITIHDPGEILDFDGNGWYMTNDAEYRILKAVAVYDNFLCDVSIPKLEWNTLEEQMLSVQATSMTAPFPQAAWGEGYLELCKKYMDDFDLVTERADRTEQAKRKQGISTYCSKLNIRGMEECYVVNVSEKWVNRTIVFKYGRIFCFSQVDVSVDGNLFKTLNVITDHFYNRYCERNNLYGKPVKDVLYDILSNLDEATEATSPKYKLAMSFPNGNVVPVSKYICNYYSIDHLRLFITCLNNRTPNVKHLHAKARRNEGHFMLAMDEYDPIDIYYNYILKSRLCSPRKIAIDSFRIKR